MKDKVYEILSSIRSDVDFTKEKMLIDDGVLESFDIVRIVTALIDEFDIYIDADDIEPENLNSFESICKLVEKKISDR